LYSACRLWYEEEKESIGRRGLYVCAWTIHGVVFTFVEFVGGEEERGRHGRGAL
jgi:hypothetical protein